MDTVNNIASAASRAIWGEGQDPDNLNTTTTTRPSGQEPVAGELGDVKHGEPYDKGNMGNTPATQPMRPKHETDKAGVTSAHQPTSATSTTKPTSSNDTAGTGPTPSVSAAPAPTHDTSASHPSNIEQGSLNPKDTLSSTQKDAIKDTKRDIETSAKHTGGAPEYHTGNGKYTEEEGTPGGMPDTIKKSLKAHESQGEGTGEKYVKSSGMNAEGGDFDAANPGAGREADRLLAEKGVHHEPAVKKTTENSQTLKDTHTSKESSGSGEKGKVSLGEKIKDKLHIHKH
ncbi:hypothetical protein HYALB_00013582 [Hymenoscyphus albidus]|uniref:Uncharacterized protein n=1 Tax=Hymenoscyphus albidus TaxID=595503 RepID=A0A9N9LTW5_9HELO|nr:hypothetical protein HYALB_00013582 [Hymenoscyphus albidus]